MQNHRFKIFLPIVGSGGRVELDGKELDCRKVQVLGALEEITTVRLELIGEVEIEGQGRVTFDEPKTDPELEGTELPDPPDA